MALALRDFDPAEYLSSPEGYAEYLAAALEEGDTANILDAIGVIARAKGMSEIARETGLARASLYRGLNSGGNPDFGTVMKVLDALGVGLTARPREVATTLA